MDIIIHPEKAACEEITRLVKHPYAVQVMDFESRRLTMLGLKLIQIVKIYMINLLERLQRIIITFDLELSQY